MESVVDAITANGFSVNSLNASQSVQFPRLLGVDISSTAVAAAHIRLAASGAYPRIYMTDTLRTGASAASETLYGSGGSSPNAIVSAARWDYEQVDRWAKRSDDRPPVISIIGNPPYERASLDSDLYTDLGWKDLYDTWRKGSGGRGSLNDPFVGFWAWAFTLFKQPHKDLANEGTLFVNEPADFDALGVVSYITNRTWIAGDSFGPMRAWVSGCLLYTSPSPRDRTRSRMPSSA